jgi:hypothetical protein
VSWVEESNHAIAEAAEDWPHTTLIDWAKAIEGHQDLLWDGIHMKPAAAGIYARLVSRAVRERVAFPLGGRDGKRAAAKVEAAAQPPTDSRVVPTLTNR